MINTVGCRPRRGCGRGRCVSPRAIEQARRKAAERGLRARFEVADALSLDQLG